MPTDADPVRVVEADCLDVLRALPDGCVDAVVTDPPYGVGFDYGTGHDDCEASYQQVIDRVMSAERLVSPGGFVAVYQSVNHARRWPEWFGRDWGLVAMPKTFTQGNRLDKGNALVPSTDYVLYWQVGKGRIRPRSWQSGMARNWYLCNTAPAMRDRLSRGHPCPRPVDGVRYLVSSLCPPGGLVLDCFAGSGTTGVACAIEGRRCLLVEREPQYVAIARKRVDEALGRTGLFASLAGAGDAITGRRGGRA